MKITEQVKFKINFVKYTKFYIYIYIKRDRKRIIKSIHY